MRLHPDFVAPIHAHADRVLPGSWLSSANRACQGDTLDHLSSLGVISINLSTEIWREGNLSLTLVLLCC